MSDFEQRLRDLLNSHSMECASNTPDYILAMYLSSCLAAFNTAVQQRETWHGRDARPSLSWHPSHDGGCDPMDTVGRG